MSSDSAQCLSSHVLEPEMTTSGLVLFQKDWLDNDTVVQSLSVWCCTNWISDKWWCGTKSLFQIKVPKCLTCVPWLVCMATGVMIWCLILKQHHSDIYWPGNTGHSPLCTITISGQDKQKERKVQSDHLLSYWLRETLRMFYCLKIVCFPGNCDGENVNS